MTTIYYLFFDDGKGNLRTAEISSRLTPEATAVAYENLHKVKVLEIRLTPGGPA